MSQRATDFFLKFFSKHKDNIESVEQIKIGFSNHVFKLILKNKTAYKVRIADNNHIISRDSEAKVAQILEDPYLLFFELSTGNAIYEWIPGRHLEASDINEEVLKQIVDLTNKYNETFIYENSPVLLHDHFDHYEEAHKNIDSKFNKKYIELVNKYKDFNIMLTHNDLSYKNLILSEETNELVLIDYEWARLNTKYWEYGNFIKETNINEDQLQTLIKLTKLKPLILQDFVYIATYYSLQLTYVFRKDIDYSNYRNRLLISLESLLNKINLLKN